jgi:hypothetical protein
MKPGLVAVAALLVAGPASASAWAEAGDAQLRSDLTILTDAGLIRVLTTQWPIPWAGIAAGLDDPILDTKPRFVREAARRVLVRVERETAQGTRVENVSDATSRPALIRGFDAQGQQNGQIQEIVDITSGGSDLHVAAGAISDARRDGGGAGLALDGSYLAQRFKGAELYVGEVGHWWGPGWISALSYSTNIRPFPQAGIASAGTQRFKTRWLRWIGPWRAEFVVGLLDDRRIARNTLFDALRFTFMPVRGLEIGFARSQILCGSGHPCSAIDAIDPINNNAHPSKTASEFVYDFKYGRTIAGHPVEIYTQMLNEDTGPFTHSFTSYVVGASAWFPVAANTLRVTGEYTSSISTRDLFSFGTVGYGISYTDYKYPDGLRYHGRAFGFSLDSDSRLASLQANLIDARDRSYTLSLHHALVSRPVTGVNNPITVSPVTIDYAEARVATPTRIGLLSLAGRLQSDQPRPARGLAAAAEITLRVRIR